MLFFKETCTLYLQLRSARLNVSSDEVSTILRDVIEKNSNVCQNMYGLLRRAIETLELERRQEVDTLEEIFTLLKDILEAVRCQYDVKHIPPSPSTKTPQPLTETEYQNIKQS